MSISIAVVCESLSDQRTGCGLADRVVYEHADWITPEVADRYRRFRGFRGIDDALLWRDVKRLAITLGIRAHGHFNDEPGVQDAHAARRALLVLKASPDAVSAVILLRDSDGQLERKTGLEQARDEFAKHSALPVILGVATIMRENWVLPGFLAQTDAEARKLAALCAGSELGFDPTLHPERLTAKSDHAKKNPKRVLAVLTGSDPERECRCWRNAPLMQLRSRGKAVGLASYLDEVRQFLLPLLGVCIPPRL